MSDWKYSKEYQEASPAEQIMLDAIVGILFDVQYAKMGNKASARRKASLEIVNAIKTAYKIHATTKL